jgi:aspartyl-tRNA(Asn)/glutamyl-tRNA(Gln) amidotransferase subunit B
MEYEIVIGLEAHAQLSTRTKLFCGCSMRFGEPPNTQTCPVCTGHPGTLPVLNRAAFEHALKTALALHCQINRETALDRKNYYYPDLPKNYQISQNYNNLGVDGHVDIEVGGQTRRIRIHNVHLEEDAGKLLHPEDVQQSTLFDLSAEERAALAGMTLVDLNRAGTPLCEIVTQPDLRSIEEASAYMETLASILLYLGVSDCKMQEGSLRFEASISLRPFGAAEYGNRVEIKNVNSMKAVVRALEYEAKRQADYLDRGERIARETRLWDDAAGRTAPMRSKEEAQDYRYFPEPDLVPVEVDEAWVERVRAAIPEMAPARRRRFVEALGLPDYDAGVLVADKALGDYFEDCVRLGAEPKAASNWVMGSVMRQLRDGATRIADLAAHVPPRGLCDLIAAVQDGTLAGSTAKEVFQEMAATGKAAAAIIAERGLRQISDTGELEAIVLRTLTENPKAVADLRLGKKQAQGFLMGQVMKATGGKANPKTVAELFARKLPEAP